MGGSSVDVGQQRIGWKYSTPLQADYLNTFLAGLSTPGLLSRPVITYGQGTSSGIDITINPFSMLIVPSDKYDNSAIDVYGNTIPLYAVKVTTTTKVTMTVSASDIAVGFTYSFTNNGNTQTQWYGEFRSLDVTDLDDFINSQHGLIIATIQKYETGNTVYYSINTRGADISDVLLREEGWNPKCWLSLVHPIRSNGGKYDSLEVRNHNSRYSGYISGNSGCRRINVDEVSYVIPGGERGGMIKNYSGFSIQSAGFALRDSNNTMPLTKVHGGMFALVNATNVNSSDPNSPYGPGEGSDITAFSNKLEIYPVTQEDINIYYDDVTETLVIN